MSAVAADDSPLGVRARRDLIARPQTYQGRRYWCVKDPVSLAYYHLREEEYEILRTLDDRVSMSRVLDVFHRRFPGLAIDAQQIRAFLAGLYRNGLITADMPGQGEKLWERRGRARRRAWLGALPGILAIRIRGIDPTRFLLMLYDYLWWVFSPVVLAVAGLTVATAALVALLRFDDILTSIPNAGTFFTAQGVILFFVAMGAVKVLHEIGHG
ncbi:MAG: hypothetical protein M3552_13315, partial [Planctomycetota bacterium]|nr:hypothetical protein [Planctomycetota bacterium]